MLIPEDAVARMLPYLRSVKAFQDLPVTSRPIRTVWNALDGCHAGLRLPLYNERLQKREPRPDSVKATIARSLALLTIFAHAAGTRQAVVSIENGWCARISFQPRPYGLNWTAGHAIDPLAATRTVAAHSYDVAVEDMLHLAPKIAFAIAGTNIGRPLDAVATFLFDAVADPAHDLDPLLAYALVRTTAGARDEADWHS